MGSRDILRHRTLITSLFHGVGPVRPCVRFMCPLTCSRLREEVHIFNPILLKLAQIVCSMIITLGKGRFFLNSACFHYRIKDELLIRVFINMVTFNYNWRQDFSW